MTAYLINIPIISLIVYAIYEKYGSNGLRAFFFPALGVKIIAGLGIGLLYFHQYGYGDTVAYHADAVKLSDLAFINISQYLKVLLGSLEDADTNQFLFQNQPRAFFLVKLLSIIYLWSGQNYWISGIYFSLFSFVGFWFLANTLVQHFPKNKLEVTISLLFFPSVVFWSSGIIKETIAMGAITLLIKLLIDWLFSKKINLKRLVFAVLLIILVWYLKYYYLGIFLITVIPLISIDVISSKKLVKANSYIVYALLFLILTALTSQLHPNFNLKNILQVIVNNHDLYVLKSQPSQFINYHNLEPTWYSLVANLPFAIGSGFFRIGIWEANQLFEYMLGLENLLLLIFAVTAIPQLFKLNDNPYKLLLLAAVIYVILLAGFLSLSAPNFGTLARYRVGYLPILVLLITCNNPLVLFLKSKFTGKVEDVV